MKSLAAAQGHTGCSRALGTPEAQEARKQKVPQPEVRARLRHIRLLKLQTGGWPLTTRVPLHLVLTRVCDELRPLTTIPVQRDLGTNVGTLQRPDDNRPSKSTPVAATFTQEAEETLCLK